MEKLPDDIIKLIYSYTQNPKQIIFLNKTFYNLFPKEISIDNLGFLDSFMIYYFYYKNINEFSLEFETLIAKFLEEKGFSLIF